jgi:hypothetical protein
MICKRGELPRLSTNSVESAMPQYTDSRCSSNVSQAINFTPKPDYTSQSSDSYPSAFFLLLTDLAHAPSLSAIVPACKVHVRDGTPHREHHLPSSIKHQNRHRNPRPKMPGAPSLASSSLTTSSLLYSDLAPSFQQHTHTISHLATQQHTPSHSPSPPRTVPPSHNDNATHPPTTPAHPSD